MFPRILADSILLLHLAFVVFVLLGGLLVIRWRWVAWVHLPMVLWSSVVNWAAWICPLTPLENLYRSAAGQSGYEEGFIEHYLTPLIYPEGLTYEAGIVLGSFVFVWNVLIYGFIWYKKKLAQ